MHPNVLGLRRIERVTDIHRITVMHWIREAGQQLGDAPESEDFREVTDTGRTAFPLSATKATSCGYGQPSITSK